MSEMPKPLLALSAISPKSVLLWRRLRQYTQQHAEHWRDQLAQVEALPQLTLLGLITGIMSGLIIVLFRWVVEIPLDLLLPHDFESFEAISRNTHFWLPFIGASLLGLAMHFIDKRHHATGINHVIDRLENHQGRMPLGNVINQFVGGAACLLTGQSVGREGPSAHMGAASGSLLGQWLRLPNNSLRPLAGCGVAAAIAACFNTPLAGVIFAMEVVMMEYTIAGFIPVTLAAVAGAGITRIAFGPEIAFMDAKAVVGNWLELPIMMLVGVVVAVFAAGYIRLQSLSCRYSLKVPIALRFGAAGLITGLCALLTPQIMGVGYDTIASAIAGEIGLGLLLLIAITKLLATGCSLGLGMPGGVVGPLLFIGACVGGALGVAAQTIMPHSASAIGFYVILGMGAMMGATLNAPLAAMMAILELTYNPNIIFPSMLVVIAACLMTRWAFKCEGLFQTLLIIQGKQRLRGKLESSDIVAQALSRTGIRSIMDRHLVYSDNLISQADASKLLSKRPRWIFLREVNQLLQPADLAACIPSSKTDAPDNKTDDLQAADTVINLLEIPARRFDLVHISADANLFEALQLMNSAQVDALWVESLSDDQRPLGIISRTKIDNYYRV